jgi:hypothetical protein
MLLRRITEHIRTQNWFAVGLDFLIVVCGVFIGIQVANWNDAQHDRQRESVYLEALVADVRKDIAGIEMTIAVETSRISALDHLIRQASGNSLPDGFNSARGRIDIVEYPPYPEDDPFDVGYTLFIMNSVPSRRAAYDTIINTGGLELLRDPDLVREIQEYYARVDSIAGFSDIMQLTRQRFVEAQRQLGMSPVDKPAMEELVRLFGTDTAMTAAAKEYWLFSNFHLRLLHSHQEAAERFLKVLESAVQP